MSYNGAGVFQLAAGNPVVTGTTISSTWANNTLSDIANNGLSNCITKDGQQTVTANIPFNGNRLTGVGNGVAASDAATIGQIQSGSAITLTGLSGTGDAIVANSAPAITAYSTGQAFLYIPTATNTVTNPTINISTVGAKTITQSNGVGLWSGALVVGTPYVIVYDGTNFRVQSGTLGGQTPVFGSRTSHRNYLIDGNFDFWRTGTSFNFTSNQAGYTADMWICGAGSGGTVTAVMSPIAVGTEPAGMTTPVTNVLQFQQSVSATTGNGISQRVEGVRTLEGRTATLSMWLWVTSGTITIPSVSLVQQFGTGGSSAVTTTVTTNWTVTTTPTRFSISIALPSISGKTMGTAGTDWLTVQLNLPSSVTFSLNTTQWQLEESPVNAPASGLPTPYEFRGYEEEVARVNRFVQVMANTGTYSLQMFGSGVFTSATNFQAWCPFVAQMRTQPIATFIAGSASSLLVQSGATFTPSAIAPVTTASSERGLTFNVTVAAATAGQGGLIRVNTTCLLIADARL